MNPNLPKEPKKKRFSLGENLKYVLFLDVLMAVVSLICALAQTGGDFSSRSNFAFALYGSMVVIALLAAMVGVILHFVSKDPNHSKIVLLSAVLLLAVAHITCFGILVTS